MISSTAFLSKLGCHPRVKPMLIPICVKASCSWQAASSRSLSWRDQHRLHSTDVITSIGCLVIALLIVFARGLPMFAPTSQDGPHRGLTAKRPAIRMIITTGACIPSTSLLARRQVRPNEPRSSIFDRRRRLLIGRIYDSVNQSEMPRPSAFGLPSTTPTSSGKAKRSPTLRAYLCRSNIGTQTSRS